MVAGLFTVLLMLNCMVLNVNAGAPVSIGFETINR